MASSNNNISSCYARLYSVMVYDRYDILPKARALQVMRTTDPRFLTILLPIYVAFLLLVSPFIIIVTIFFDIGHVINQPYMEKEE
eukprot:scaffold29670_cov55-Attheya_sp.AAC.13